MQRGGRYRGRSGYNGRGRSSAGKPPSSNRLKGLFADGIWQCNCSPRLPAEHFKVKKEGPNKGRWFYTCQQNEPKRCDFFLWDEDAKPREEAAVLSNSRTEPAAEQIKTPAPKQQNGALRGRGMFAGMDCSTTREDSPTPSPSPSPMLNRSKRNARDAGLDGDQEEDDFGWAFSGNDEEELRKVADTTPFETPRKSPKTGVYATPATTGRKNPRTLPWLEPPSSPSSSTQTLEPMTPATTRKSVIDYFETPSKAPVKPMELTRSEQPKPTVHFEDLPTTPTVSNPAAATMPSSPSPPSRHRDALVNPADSRSSLTGEVLAELADVNLSAEKHSRLRSILSKHDLRTQGVVMGRDISRRAIKDKEARIVELEARIARLEAERETDRVVMRQLRWKQDIRQSGLLPDDLDDDGETSQL